MSRPERSVVAYMRKWAFDNEIPQKVKGRWPTKFKFLPVTMTRCLPDDVPLFAEAIRSGEAAERGG